MSKAKKIDSAKQASAQSQAKSAFASLPKKAGKKIWHAGFAFRLACEPEALRLRADSFHFEAFWACYGLPQLHGSDSRPNISGFANRAMRAIQGFLGACPAGADESSRAWHAGAEIARAKAASLALGQEIKPDWERIDSSCPLDSCSDQSKACLKNGKLAIAGFEAACDWIEEQAAEAAQADILSEDGILLIESSAPESESESGLILPE